MKSRSDTKLSQPVRMRLFRLGPSDNRNSSNSKSPPAAMSSENIDKEVEQDSDSTPVREIGTPAAAFDGSASPLAGRGSIRKVSDGNPTASPRSPGSPLSGGIKHYAPARAAAAFVKSPESLQGDGQLLSPGTPASDMSEGWSAVGKATIGGKSGKVIERLQSEIDQLKRGLRASEAKYDEARTLYDTVIAERDELRASKETHDSIRMNNETLLARRDRKIEQLREDLEEETGRRVAAETLQRQAAEIASKRIDTLDAQRHKAMDESSYFKNQYDVLERSMTQLRAEYQTKTKKLSKVTSTLTAEMEADQKTMKRYEAGAEQLRANYERSTQASKDMAALYEAYKAARESELSEFRTNAEQNALKLQELERELAETCGRMRQVMNIKETFKGDFKE